MPTSAPVALTDTPRALKQLAEQTGKPLPTYSALYAAAVGGADWIERRGARWFVIDLDKAAAAFGLIAD